MTAKFTTIPFATADKIELCGDLFLPAGKGPHPVVVAVPGGGWLRGGRGGLHDWGRHLSDQGMAVFVIDYRRSTNGRIFPENAEDVACAMRFVQDKAGSLGLDSGRIAVLGASAGAHLSSLVALSDAFETPKLAALVAVYGVYDLVDHWQADLVANAAPGADITERMMGCAPYEDQRRYFDASPIRHVSYARNTLATLVIWGKEDLDVLPRQSEHFAEALRQARFPVRTLPVPGAGHYWFSDQPIDEPGSHAGVVAPAIIRFLRQHFGGMP